jgi:predicted patatin/cPLA2 family phospholipase
LSSSPEQETKTPEMPQGLEEKLTTLKRLREQGLITEEEYQEKKKELLKEF